MDGTNYRHWYGGNDKCARFARERDLPMSVAFQVIRVNSGWTQGNTHRKREARARARTKDVCACCIAASPSSLTLLTARWCRTCHLSSSSPSSFFDSPVLQCTAAVHCSQVHLSTTPFPLSCPRQQGKRGCNALRITRIKRQSASRSRIRDVLANSFARKTQRDEM